MEVNREEAIRCLNIARNKLSGGDAAGAVRFTRKSLALFPTSEAESFLEKAQVAEREGVSTGTSTSTSTSSEPSSSTTQRKGKEPVEKQGSREHTPGRQERSYTPEQATDVARIKACRVTAYYEILGVTKEATDGEVKKAYRRLALKFHPDKNSAPGADEAFKMISRAFSVLQDEDKRAHFDRYGEEGERRGGGGGGGAPTFHHRGGGGGAPFMDGEIDPQDIFNMFFGGGGMGGGDPFGGATFLGPGGIRFQQFGGARRAERQRRPAAPAEPETLITQLLRLLPFLVMLFFFFSPGTFLFSEEPPAFGFHSTRLHPHAQTTQQRGVQYFVDQGALKRYMSANPGTLRQYEGRVERDWGKVLLAHCQKEEERRRHRISESYNWYGSRDEERYQAALNMAMPLCEQYHAYL